MFTFQGIAVDSYVMFERECTVVCSANGTEIEIELGHRAGSLHLITNLDGLEKFVGAAGELLRRVRAVPDGEDVDIRVPDRPEDARVRPGGPDGPEGPSGRSGLTPVRP